MSEELEKMFADLRDYEWYTPFQEGVDELKAKVEEELKTSKRAELEKIKAEIEQDAFKDVNGSKYIFVNRVNQIIDKYKAEREELKGENNEQKEK